MSDITKQDCPICGTPAGFRPIDHGRKKKFECQRCKVFIISPSCEKNISKLFKSEKEKLSKASAQCTEKTILLIITTDRQTIGHRCVQSSDWF